jgi:hypothetical protein
MCSLENSTTLEGKTSIDEAIVRYRRRVTITRLVLVTTVLVELALVIRLAMKLIGVESVYAITDPLVFPFMWISTNSSVKGSVLEIPTLVAMLAYALLGWMIGRIILRIFEKRRLERPRGSFREDSSAASDVGQTVVGIGSAHSPARCENSDLSSDRSRA